MRINVVQKMCKKQLEFMGDNHIAIAIWTQMQDDAFTKSDEEKSMFYFILSTFTWNKYLINDTT